MNKMFSGMQGLPPGFPPLPVLPPQAYYPSPPMQTYPYHHVSPYQHGGYPAHGYGQQPMQSTLGYSAQQYTPYPALTDIGGSVSTGSHPGAIGAGSFSGGHSGGFSAPGGFR
ncbi:DNA helicase [Bacillus sp. ISL-51]|uniref:DNA helicase n=1 Tax=unclassified Bacillus (in: firmicutes) TaxID=185979 RepID=UPI001BE9B9CB|nr:MULTISPECIES: DNA helicase [unclassified Bacillus (in: firmicutes)]MBT2574204.1 DNA helicase [Bacillus sp. ISL-51]MBT2633023.1 DNA helicase [Bacillus sp. ISL-26]